MPSLSYEFPNSQFFVSDATARIHVPILGDDSVLVSSDCLAVATMTASDGPTRLRLHSASHPFGDVGLSLRWHGSIPARGRLAVTDIYAELIAGLACSGDVAVQLFTNDKNEPDDVALVVGVASSWELLTQPRR